MYGRATLKLVAHGEHAHVVGVQSDAKEVRHGVGDDYVVAHGSVPSCVLLRCREYEFSKVAQQQTDGRTQGREQREEGSQGCPWLPSVTYKKRWRWSLGVL